MTRSQRGSPREGFLRRTKKGPEIIRPDLSELRGGGECGVAKLASNAKVQKESIMKAIASNKEAAAALKALERAELGKRKPEAAPAAAL